MKRKHKRHVRLTKAEVIEIKDLYKRKWEVRLGQVELALKFGVSQPTISRINTGRHRFA